MVGMTDVTTDTTNTTDRNDRPVAVGGIGNYAEYYSLLTQRRHCLQVGLLLTGMARVCYSFHLHCLSTFSEVLVSLGQHPDRSPMRQHNYRYNRPLQGDQYGRW